MESPKLLIQSDRKLTVETLPCKLLNSISAQVKQVNRFPGFLPVLLPSNSGRKAWHCQKEVLFGLGLCSPNE